MDGPALDVALHAALEPIAFLLGTWRGSGKGIYPSIDDFTYEEESRFWHVGKPFLAYQQRTWAAGSGAPMHSEMGYWRPQPAGGIEIVISHPFGYAEIQTGTVSGTSIVTRSLSLAPTPSAKSITEVTRSLSVADDVLTYAVSMAAEGYELQAHLEAELLRS